MKIFTRTLLVLAFVLPACCKDVPPEIDTKPVQSASSAPKPVQAPKATAPAGKGGTASAAEIDEMFGNELDRIDASQRYVKTAAIEVAKTIGKNDAETFIAHIEDSFVLAGKRLTKEQAAAKIREGGLQATVKITPLQGIDKAPYGIGWRLTSVSKSDVFGVTSGSGYGTAWVVSCKALPNGSFTVLSAQQVNLGSP